MMTCDHATLHQIMTLIAMFMLVCTVIYRAILAQHSSECHKNLHVYIIPSL